MPYCIVKGTALPGGTLAGWTKTSITADITAGDGWVIEGPVAEVWPWMGGLGLGVVMLASAGVFDPTTLGCHIRAVDWNSCRAVAANAVSTIPQLKTAILSANTVP